MLLGSHTCRRCSRLLLIGWAVVAIAAASAADLQAVFVGDSVLVPLRVTLEWLGASVQYNDGRIIATNGGTSVALRIGGREAVINGKTVKLAQAPTVRDGRTYIPLRFVAESMGAKVTYDAAARQVVVTDGDRSLVIPITVVVKRVYLSATRCSVCGEKHGNVHVVLGNREDMTITRDGNARSPKLAKDGFTVGWLRGSHMRVWDTTQFVVAALVLYRDGHVLREITGQRGMVWDWQFVGSGRCALATGAAKRGIQFYELWDIATGQLIERQKSQFWMDADPKPEWAAGLPDYE